MLKEIDDELTPDMINPKFLFIIFTHYFFMFNYHERFNKSELDTEINKINYNAYIDLTIIRLQVEHR